MKSPIAAVASTSSAAAITFVVAVTDDAHSYECSGVLVGPHLVFTARHCIDTPSSAIVDCESTVFFRVSADTAIRVAQCADTSNNCTWHASAALYRPANDSFCGQDFAAIVTDDAFAGPFATPAVAAIDLTQPYAVVALGGVDASGSGGGIRRELRDQSLACAAGGDGALVDCAHTGDALLIDNAIARGELYSAPGICPGDSGGPLFVDATLTTNAAVFGLVSREVIAGDTCPAAIVSPISAFGSVLSAAAQRASAIDGSPLPAWAIPVVTSTLVPAGGCAINGARRSQNGESTDAMSGVLFVLLVLCLRKRFYGFAR